VASAVTHRQCREQQQRHAAAEHLTAKPTPPGASGRRCWLSTLPTDQLLQAMQIETSPLTDAENADRA